MSDLIDLKIIIINMLKEWKETVVKVKKKKNVYDDNIISNSKYLKKEIIKKNQMEILELKSTYN